MAPGTAQLATVDCHHYLEALTCAASICIIQHKLCLLGACLCHLSMGVHGMTWHRTLAARLSLTVAMP